MEGECICVEVSEGGCEGLCVNGCEGGKNNELK